MAPATVSAALAADYAEGRVNSHEVASRLGCSQPTALKRLRDAGVDTSRHRGREPRVSMSAADLKRYEDGHLTVQDFAEARGCSLEGARKALLRAKARRRRRGRPEGVASADRLARLLRWLLGLGYQAKCLAEVLGVTPQTVRQLARE